MPTVNDFVKLVKACIYGISIVCIVFILLMAGLFAYYIHKSYNSQMQNIQAEQTVDNNSLASQEIR